MKTTRKTNRNQPVDPRDAIVQQCYEQAIQKGTPFDEDAFTELMKDISRRLIETALKTELSHHLEGKKVAAADDEAEEVQDAISDDEAAQPRNKRNGFIKKKVRTQFGELDIQSPRDRLGTFEPTLVPKRSRTMDKLNEQIIALYGRGMTVREIRAFLEELYGIDVSPDFVSRATESVLDEVKEWQNRPLESIYSVVFFDALRVKIRSGAGIKNMAVHLALGVNRQGHRDVLGIWISENEGAAFWTNVFSELKNRGISDIMIAVTDGLKGMTQAIQAVFPNTLHQTCIVHLIRSSTAFVSHKDRKAVCAGLKAIYQAVNAEAAADALDAFEASAMGKRYPAITQAWRRVWTEVVPFFNFAPAIRKLIYTTNAIEGLNRAIRKVTKSRSLFPHEEAAKKLIFLAIRNFQQTWKRATIRWGEAMPAFAAMFGERFTAEEE